MTLRNSMQNAALAAATFVAAAGVPQPAAAQGLDSPVIPADRRIEWKPGIPGGIPTYPVFASVTNAPYHAKGDGKADDTAAIQKAIDDCPEGKAVHVPAGTYRLTEQIRILKGIALRGDGPARTRLVTEATAKHGIWIGDWGNEIRTRIVSGFTRGSTNIVVADASRIRPSELLMIDQLNDPDLVDPVGCGGLCGWAGGGKGTRAMGQLVQVTAIEGGNLTLSRPLYSTFKEALQPEAVRLADRVVSRAGLEDFYIETARPHTDTSSTIKIMNAVQCWVRNVEASKAWFGGSVTFQSSLGCEVRDSYFHHPLRFGGGYGYGVWVFAKSTDTRVENNVFHYLASPMMIECGGPGNVFAYNFSSLTFGRDYPDTDWANDDISMHGAHSYMNLFEGNYVSAIAFDFYWGSSSHTTVFRNYADMDIRMRDGRPMMAIIGVRIDTRNYFENVVGNVLGCEGTQGVVDPPAISNFTQKLVWRLGYSKPSGCGAPDDPKVRQTLLRHGNYDAVSRQTAWDSAIPARDLPASLYLAAKPAWFGDLRWPAIGPDLKPMAGTIPARERFLKMMTSGEREAQDLLFMGDFLVAAGKSEEGRKAFRELAEKHGGTPYAAAARTRLGGEAKE